MKIKVIKKLQSGTMEIEVEGRNEKDALSKALFYLQPDYCFLCKSNNVIWTYNKAISKKDGKMYTYIKRKCLSCKAESLAGEYTEGGLFWKNFESVKYERKSKEPIFEDDPNSEAQIATQEE